MRRTLLLLTLLACVAASAAPVLANATITIVNNNAANVGFNDPTPVAPVGGNTGTTLGQQRLIAFQYAASIWGATLDSPRQIKILSSFTALSCNATSAVLGSAGTRFIFANFQNAPLLNTWHSQALANKLSNQQLNTTANDADINANFNVNLGNPGCLTGIGWYLGLDSNHGTQIDLVTVLLHEFGHGLGFQQFASLTTGAESNNFSDVYNRNLYDNTLGLTWNQMTNAQRVTSGLNTRKLVWVGPKVTAELQGILAPGVPGVQVNSPAAIAGLLAVGEAQFGAPLASPGFTNSVVQALDPADANGPTTFDACSPITNAAAISGKIALVDRGTCGFVVKAKNVQDAGAMAMIVADNVAGSPPAGMAGVDPTIFIPSVRISLPDGNAIKGQLAGGVNATIGKLTNLLQGADANFRAQMYAPNPTVSGSSVSHWDTVAFPNQLMEPNINGDLTHNVTGVDLTLAEMRDVGWYADADVDLVPDANDNCPYDANPSQADLDGDTAGDACDADDDNDGVNDDVDNCPVIANADQANHDADTLGDACDPDDDNDGVLDGADNCVIVANTDQADNDGDTQGDACDADDDNDGVLDAGDNCVFTANADQADNDGDALGDACDPDDDNDGVLDGSDNCVFVANADQADNDGDAVGDACDGDDDNDGVADAGDACPFTAPDMGLDADHNGCTDTLAGLKAIVSGLPVPPNLKNGLLGKLSDAEKALARGATYVAVNKLFDFISQVEGVRGGYIDNATADLLEAYARNLIKLLGGPKQTKDPGNA
jgi:hypothetical protein